MARITIDTGTDVIEMEDFPVEEIHDEINGLKHRLNRYVSALNYWNGALEASAELPPDHANPGLAMRAKCPLWKGIPEAQRTVQTIQWKIKFVQAQIMYLEALREAHLEEDREASRIRMEADLVDIQTGAIDRDEAYARYG